MEGAEGFLCWSLLRCLYCGCKRCLLSWVHKDVTTLLVVCSHRAVCTRGWERCPGAAQLISWFHWRNDIVPNRYMVPCVPAYIVRTHQIMWLIWRSDSLHNNEWATIWSHVYQRLWNVHMSAQKISRGIPAESPAEIHTLCADFKHGLCYVATYFTAYFLSGLAPFPRGLSASQLLDEKSEQIPLQRSGVTTFFFPSMMWILNRRLEIACCLHWLTGFPLKLRRGLWLDLDTESDRIRAYRGVIRFSVFTRLSKDRSDMEFKHSWRSLQVLGYVQT